MNVWKMYWIPQLLDMVVLVGPYEECEEGQILDISGKERRYAMARFAMLYSLDDELLRPVEFELSTKRDMCTHNVIVIVEPS